MLPAITLYLLGSLLVMTLLEPDEGYETKFLTFVILWPLFAGWLTAMEMLNRDQE